MQVITVIQARMASTRLPGKVLLPVPGWRRATLLSVVLHRVHQAVGTGPVIVATSGRPEDEAIGAEARRCGAAWFDPGASLDPNDVLRRYVRCADRYKADAVVRLTADCPLLDPAVLTRCIQVFAAWGRKDHDFPRADFVGTSPAFPDGMDVEIASAEVLGHALSSERASDHEHVMPAVRRLVLEQPQASLPTIWSGRLVEPAECGLSDQYAGLRLTVDEWPDYALVCGLLHWLGPDVSLARLCQAADERPWLFAGNRGIGRNEGLARSLAAERTVPACP